MEPETFLTLDDVPEEHRDTLKQLMAKKERDMQGAYTKKTQAVGANRQKLEAYEAFERDPHNTLARVASQLGYQLTPAGGGQPGGQPGQPAQPASRFADPNYQPQTWGELASEIRSSIAADLVPQIVAQLGGQMSNVIQPLARSVEQITSATISQKLDQVDPNWRLYEDDIKATMRQNPTLIQTDDGIRKLYLMSVPEDVIAARYTQRAVTKINDRVNASKPGSRSQVNQAAPAAKKASNFNDAVAIAKEQLAKGQGG